MRTVSAGEQSPHDALDDSVRAGLRDIRATGDDPDTGGARSNSHLHTIFDAMAGSRLLDIHARRLRESGRGFYTIGSAGHESNAFVAAALRPGDPALLHYRSGAFFLMRAMQAGRTLDDALRAVLLGMLASTADPASGGRHKVWGDAALAVMPQTSTIASHLPRALGVALSLARAKRLGVPNRWQPDAVTVCSFGDASINHSTAVGALNAAGYAAVQGLPLPLLFVCEDNGIGISVPTPAGWVAAAAQRPGIKYFAAAGDDPDGAAAQAQAAADFARRRRRPALLHLTTVRYLSHAGSDVEAAYRASTEIGADRAKDPLLALGRRLGDPHLADRYAEIDACIAAIADDLADTPTLRDAAAVMAPLAPRAAAPLSAPVADDDRRREVFGAKLPEDAGPMTLAQSINAALTDSLAARPEMLVFGEDVGRKGGVYGVTRGLQQRFGAARVFDTLLDEQSILGFGLGLGVSGMLPVPEIQYLAYLHNAEDQLRGEAASLRFFSDGAFTNPLVLRVQGLAYQKGFGGHFHNDNAVAVLRDIPGLVVAVPSRPEDAAPMLRGCLTAARATGQVSVFLEPIALYHERDLHEPGDRGWLGSYSPDAVAQLGSARLHDCGTDGTDLTIVTFGNGVRMSLRVARRLAAEGRAVQVLDLRWIVPLNFDEIFRAVSGTNRVLVADETRHNAGVGEGVLAMLIDAGYPGRRLARVASRDSFVPLGDAANLVLLGEDEIERVARALLAR
ncbi:thiamine pyrophosphate-dependent enzyme [uncultured Jatrophihabitans sp.]|uniref:thiamine pyrophosphate-dependent enzyme n=1 Tax=uncultured Jatrophihabitans sp. TaxID=1610747 RepID=UPI0035C9AC37